MQPSICQITTFEQLQLEITFSSIHYRDEKKIQTAGHILSNIIISLKNNSVSIYVKYHD